MRSLRDTRNALRAGLSRYRSPFGETRKGSIVGAFEGNELYMYLFESAGYSGYKSE
jgi:hypothetical protein